MAEGEFAPVTPGEMLKEGFLAELRPVASPTCEGHRHFVQPDR